MLRPVALPLALLLCLSALASPADEAGKKFELKLQHRAELGAPGDLSAVVEAHTWDAAETAIIVCDMWDLHHCHNAVTREQQMAPVMARLINEARSRGAVIIHAPSDCMDAYKDHPARKHATATPRANTYPPDIAKWCYKIRSEERATYPIDQSDGGEDDDPADHGRWVEELKRRGKDPARPWTRQIDAIGIEANDYISDKGEEVWSILEDRKIKNVALMGVHLNMCVLGRPFGLRRLSRTERNVVLVRDMTDTMYNPKASPRVGHFRGTELMVEYVETYICPTISSDQILGGEPFRFLGDKGPGNACAGS